MLSKRISNLQPYIPGEQPQDRSYIKLNTNENPYPPAPHIEELLHTVDLDALRLYPDPRMEQLRDAIARHYRISRDQVFTGNGSDEVLAFLFYAFFDSTYGPLLFPDITYSFYPVYCRFFGIDYRNVPLREDFTIDLEDYTSVSSCGVIFPNPNAPTGIEVSIPHIEVFLRAYSNERLVVVDEAYAEFGGGRCTELIDTYENLLLVGTFSKSTALAGARIGYALGNPQLIHRLFTVKDSFNSYPLGTLSQQIGITALQHWDYYQTIIETIIRTRERTEKALKDRGWTVLPSKANFMCAGKPGVSGQQVYRRLKESGILVRYFDAPRIKDFVRITIGTDEQMETLLQTIDTVL